MNTSKLLMHALAAAGLLATAIPAFAHIEYYDLNQGKQIGDLTAAGVATNDEEIRAMLAEKTIEARRQLMESQ